MTTRDRLSVASAVAVLLSCSALLPVFDGQGWVVRVAVAVLSVAGGAALGRYLGLPRGLQPLAGVLGLAVYTAFAFAGETLSYGLVPTGETLRVLGDSIGEGLLDVEELAPPVPTNPGLVLLAALGAGAVMVVVDTLAVVLRQAAAAGLPLLLLFAVPSAVLADGLGVVPFVLGAAGWLGLLLADSSDTVSRWGTPLQAKRGASTADPSLGRVGRRIGVAALGVAVVVPALVPGLDARLLGNGDGDGFGGGSRSIRTYNPITRLAGQLSLPQPVELLRYTTDDPSPDYLRLTTLDVFDPDRGWSSSELSGDPDDDRARDGGLRPEGLTATREDFSTTVELSGQLDGPWLPTPFPPDDVDVRGPWLWDEQAETLFSTRTSLVEVEGSYTVRADRLSPSVELLRAEQSPPSEISETYAVPPALSDYVRRELDAVTGDQDTAYDKVAALQAYFRENPGRFTYDEDATAEGINSESALEDFLRSGQGYCEQYASAMAAMVRGLGIPARVAVGFTRGVRDGEQYVVTTSEAHAWPEVWFRGAGWVRFEPTPRTDDQESTPDYSTAPEEPEVTPSASAAPSAAPSEAPLLPDDPAAIDRGEDIGPTAGDAGGAGLSPWLLLVPGVLLVLAFPWLLARLRARRRWSTPGPLTAWSAVVDDAVDVGHRWRPSDSPRTAAAHLLSVRPLPAAASEALLRLAGSAERARYARADGQDAHAPATLRRDAAAVRSGLLASAPGRTRWLARLAPPSTLRWASSSLGTAVADLLDRVDTTVTAAGDRLRRPGARRAG